MAPLPPGRFLVLDKGGRGAFGEVLRGWDREAGAPVAIKRLHDYLGYQAAIEKFAQEARLLARVASENVVRYVAHGLDEEGRACLVLEWLEGEDLEARRRRGPFERGVAMDIVRQAAWGLAALHMQGIVHRDVKPANLFLVGDERGEMRVKVLDLGIARGDERDEGDGAVGTPFYMSPEQARGERTISPASDVFSLGVLLFELLAGQKPYTGADPLVLLAKITLQDPPRLAEAWRGAPRALDELVARAMAKDPARRLPSGREMALALEALPDFRGRFSMIPPDPASVPISSAPFVGAAVEQRVVSALFGKVGPGGDVESAKEVFAQIAAELGGIAHPLLGPNMVAVFGGARTQGDEARRAARAALAAARALGEVRLSLATGRALARGSGIAGEILERGARELEDPRPGAGGQAIAIDAATARLVGDAFVVVEEGDRRSLSALFGPDHAAPARTLLGKPAPCLGREAELAALEAAFSACVAEGRARAAVVLAPAGMGKSRLRQELMMRIGARCALRLLGRSDSLTAGAPFGLLGDALRRHTGLLDREPLPAQQLRLTCVLGRHLPPERSVGIPERLGEIAGVPFEANAAGVRDAMVTGDLTRAAWEEWLAAECARGPVALVLEDLHWGDAPSLRLVDGALGALADRPLFVLALGRTEALARFPDLFGARAATRISLEPLAPAAAAEIARAALGEAATPAALEAILSRAGGNPFFLEELVRAVAEGTSASLPDNVLGVVQARFDALGEAPKRLLKAASVFGDSFRPAGVRALLGEEVPAALFERLVEEEILAPGADVELGEEQPYGFRHAFLREAAHAMLAEEDRALAHRLAGKWLEGTGVEDATRLAEHYDRGGEPARAGPFYVRGAEEALRAYDSLAAVARARRAKECGVTGEELGRAKLTEAEAHRWRAEFEDGAGCAIEAAELLSPGTARWFQAVRELIAVNGRLGRFDLVEVWAGEACAGRPQDGATGAQIAALAPACVHLTYAGREEAAARLAERIEALCREAGALEPLVAARVHQFRAIRAAHHQDVEAALGAHHLTLEQFESAGDMRNACLTMSNLGFTQMLVGELEDAEASLRGAQALAERMGLRTVIPFAQHNLGAVLYYRGERLEEARRAEEQAVAAFARQGDPRLEAASRVYLSQILLSLGDAQGAEEAVRAALGNENAGEQMRVGLHAQLARVLGAKGETEASLAAAREAMRLLEPLGVIEDFDALARLSIAEAFEQAGHRAAAERAMASALERLEERAERLKNPRLREGFLRRISVHARTLALAEAWGIARSPS